MTYLGETPFQKLIQFETIAISRKLSKSDIFSRLGKLDSKFSNHPEYDINVNGVLCNIGASLSQKEILNYAAKRIKILLAKEEYKNTGKLEYDYGNILVSIEQIDNPYPHKIQKLIDGTRFADARAQFEKIKPNDSEYLSAVTNISIIFNKYGRVCEAIEISNKVLRKNPNFGMALANKASSIEYFIRLAPQKSLRLMAIARDLYQKALLDIAIDSIGGENARPEFLARMNSLSSYLDDSGYIHDNCKIPAEIRDYQKFCLTNNLFLNHDFGYYYDELSIKDVLFPSFIENLNEDKSSRVPHMSERIYFAFHIFNQLLEAFTTARQQYFYVLHNDFSEFDYSVEYAYTLDYTQHSHKYGLLKIILGCLYNCLDKIGHLIYYYFIGVAELKNDIHFNWLLGDDFRRVIIDKDNYQLLALRNLALDFQLGYQYNHLSKIRNRITHSFININSIESHSGENFTYEITEYSLQESVNVLFVVVKSAILYAVNAINLEGYDKDLPKMNTIKEKDIFKKT